MVSCGRLAFVCVVLVSSNELGAVVFVAKHHHTLPIRDRKTQMRGYRLFTRYTTCDAPEGYNGLAAPDWLGDIRVGHEIYR